MKTISIKIIFLFVFFINFACGCDDMNTNVFNQANQQVIVFDKYSDILSITTDISGQVYQGRNVAYYFPLEPMRRYQINQIDLTLNLFRGVTTPTQVAFPNNEQFSVVGQFKLRTTLDTNALTTVDTLLQNLYFNTTNGFPVSVIDNSFIVNNYTNNILYLVFSSSDVGCNIPTLSGFTLPPTPPDGVLLYFTIKVQGVSYSLIPDSKQERTQEETDTPNAIDIEI